MTKTETIIEIKRLLFQQPSSEDIARWQADERIGVQKLLRQYEKKQER
mgnify:FL=1